MRVSQDSAVPNVSELKFHLILPLWADISTFSG